MNIRTFDDEAFAVDAEAHFYFGAAIATYAT